MLPHRRLQSSPVAASITTSLIVVLLAVAVHGTASRPSRSARLKCFEHSLGVVACPPGELCVWVSFTWGGVKQVKRFCASQGECDKYIAKPDYRVACCSTDRCNENYDTATATTTTTTTSTTATKTTPTTTTTTTTTTPSRASTSAATSAVQVNTTVEHHPTTTEATIESTTDSEQPLPPSSTSADRSTTTSQRSTATTGHASAASQSMPGRLTSIPAPANSTSPGPSPKTSSSDASIDNVTRTDISTESAGTKGPLETTPTAANADKIHTSTASSSTFSAPTSTVDQTGSSPTSAPLTSTNSGKEQSGASPMSFAWIGLLSVGVIGAIIFTVLFVLAFLGIVCAPKQSPGLDIVPKELDKTLI